MNSITKRWVRGSLLFTLLVLLIAEAFFVYYVFSGYYDRVDRAVSSQLEYLTTQLSLPSSATNEERALRLMRTIEQFDEKGRYEVMLVDTNGRIVATSSGVVPLQTSVPADIASALSPTSSGTAYYRGRSDMGERIYAITQRTPYTADGICAIRVATSLAQVDLSIARLILFSVVLLLVVVLASVMSGVYFIRSIVLPLQKVEATASNIARGEFGTRIDIESNDEIGSLCHTINEMAQALSENERMKNDFISSVSHELRTPLTSIKGWVETVGDLQNTQDPNYRRGIKIIGTETDRLYDMVEELLDFSRLQNNLALKNERIDLAAELEDALLVAQQRIETAQIDLAYNVPDEPVPVLADKNRLRQVFLNILDNATKYTQPGGHINAQLWCDGSDAVVEMTDNGAGIAAEDLANIKVKFYKGKGSVRGSGIGLAVADEIVAAHGGTLTIESVEGEGTTVTIRLPLSPSGTGRLPEVPHP